jgi:FixJ family two-component response regulator
VVDDDRSVYEAIKSLVRSVGLRARRSGRLKNSCARSPWGAPSCLVLDVRLPGLSGLDFQYELAQQNGGT